MTRHLTPENILLEEDFKLHCWDRRYKGPATSYKTTVEAILQQLETKVSSQQVTLQKAEEQGTIC